MVYAVGDGDERPTAPDCRVRPLPARPILRVQPPDQQGKHRRKLALLGLSLLCRALLSESPIQRLLTIWNDDNRRLQLQPVVAPMQGGAFSRGAGTLLRLAGRNRRRSSTLLLWAVAQGAVTDHLPTT
jgi:hypothetical protein